MTFKILKAICLNFCPQIYFIPIKFPRKFPFIAIKKLFTIYLIYFVWLSECLIDLHEALDVDMLL